jgi:hypothetical protein
MDVAASPIVYLKDYTAPAFLITRVELDTALFEDDAVVRATLAVERNREAAEAAAALQLDVDELTLETVSVNGIALHPGPAPSEHSECAGPFRARDGVPHSPCAIPCRAACRPPFVGPDLQRRHRHRHASGRSRLSSAVPLHRQDRQADGEARTGGAVSGASGDGRTDSQGSQADRPVCSASYRGQPGHQSANRQGLRPRSASDACSPAPMR